MKIRHLLLLIPIFLMACAGPGPNGEGGNPPPPPPQTESEAPLPTVATEAEGLPEPEVEVSEAAEEAVIEEEAAEPEETTADTAANPLASNYLGSYTISDTGFGTQVNVTVDDAAKTRTIESNSLPNHETGEFPNPGNPNEISEQDSSWTFPTEPTFTGTATFARTPGVAINGVKFEPNTAERATCETGEVYSIEAIQDVTDLGLDFNNAHVQPTGEYHYHGVSQLLVEAFDTDQDLVHVAFAADGHKMYYSKSGAYSSSYRLGTGERVGTNCTYTSPAPSGGATISFGSVKDGSLDADWDFDLSYGDLDECNGTTVNGEYIYLITDDYPYISRCLMGETSGGGQGGGQGGPPQGGGEGEGGRGGRQQGGGQGGPPDLAAAAEALGVSEDALREAIGGPPPDFEAASAALGISVEELQNALGGPPPQQ
ncbi:MAG: YHYH protein [Chloroflexota bacterium]